MTRYLLLTLLFGAAFAAACSSSNAPPTNGQSLLPASPRAASTPLDYIYVANYNGSDVAQWAFNPKSKPVMKPLAANYKLPSGCSNPDSLAVVPHENRVFVSCYSGQIVALAIGKNHTLTASKIKPVAVPSPLYVVAPRSGVAGRLYASEYAGSVAELGYTSKSLKVLNTYPTGSVYPNQMAFYTNGQKQSTLFVAAPYASGSCGSTGSGAILVYRQVAGGALAVQSPIPACGGAYNVVAANNKVYWAGPNALGGYNLKYKKLLPSPAPPWPAGQGPPYYSSAMSLVHPQPMKQQAGLADNDSASGDFQVAANNGTITIFDGNLKPLVTWSGVTSTPAPGSHCQDYTTGITVGGKLYRTVCWQLVNDEIVVYGLTKPYGRVVDFGKFATGDFPIAFAFMLSCSPYTYYAYDCY